MYDVGNGGFSNLLNYKENNSNIFSKKLMSPSKYEDSRGLYPISSIENDNIVRNSLNKSEKRSKSTTKYRLSQADHNTSANHNRQHSESQLKINIMNSEPVKKYPHNKKNREASNGLTRYTLAKDNHRIGKNDIPDYYSVNIHDNCKKSAYCESHYHLNSTNKANRQSPTIPLRKEMIRPSKLQTSKAYLSQQQTPSCLKSPQKKSSDNSYLGNYHHNYNNHNNNIFNGVINILNKTCFDHNKFRNDLYVHTEEDD